MIAGGRMSHLKTSSSKVAQTVAILQQAQSVLFITGAGISAASGLPTYRGIGGLYNNRLTEDDISIEFALSGMMMVIDPAVTWTYLSQIERTCRGAKFNRAHEIIAQMEQYFERACVLTQNVDGFHRDAGSQNVIDIHGDLHDLYCLQCDYTTRVTDYSALEIPPKCPSCGYIIRPDVILFGEFLPQDKVAQLTAELQQGFEVIFTIGTTSVFPYIAGPVRRAAQMDIPTIEINPGTTEVSEIVSIKFDAGAVEALSSIWAELTKRMSNGQS